MLEYQFINFCFHVYISSTESTVSGKGWKESVKSSSWTLQTEDSDNRPERIFLWALGDGLDLVSHFTLIVLRQDKEYFERNSPICCLITMNLFSVWRPHDLHTRQNWTVRSIFSSKMLSNFSGRLWFSALNVHRSPTNDIPQKEHQIFSCSASFGGHLFNGRFWRT